MKKRIFLNIIICLVLAAVAFLTGAFFQKDRDERQRAASLNAKRALDERHDAEQELSAVSLAPGTSREMLYADYWKTGEDSELLFTEKEIKDYLHNNPLYVAYFDEAAGRTLKLMMNDLPEELDGSAVRVLSDPAYIDRMAEGSETVFVNGRAPDSGYWDSLRDNCAFDRIGEKVKPQYCICVKRTLAMIVPTEDFASGDINELYCNVFISAEVMPLTGAVALHESLDGQWCFVIYGSYCGWVKKDCLAFCKDKEEWLEAANPEDFLIVTGCEITLDETAVRGSTDDLTLPMGTKIKLLKDHEGQVNGRETYGCYVTQIPARGADGALTWETVLIPVSKEVTAGYLTMTSDAVIEQAFKFLGKIYGWGGSFASNDCSGIVRQIYACFGFELPRNSAAIGQNFDLGARDFSIMTADKKLDIIKKLKAGSLLTMDGHMMIYLGTVDGKPYVISSCGTFYAPGDYSGSPVNAYGVFVSGLDLLRADGSTWLESLTYFQSKDY